MASGTETPNPFYWGSAPDGGGGGGGGGGGPLPASRSMEDAGWRCCWPSCSWIWVSVSRLKKCVCQQVVLVAWIPSSRHWLGNLEARQANLQEPVWHVTLKRSCDWPLIISRVGWGGVSFLWGGGWGGGGLFQLEVWWWSTFLPQIRNEERLVCTS